MKFALASFVLALLFVVQVLGIPFGILALVFGAAGVILFLTGRAARAGVLVLSLAGIGMSLVGLFVLPGIYVERGIHEIEALKIPGAPRTYGPKGPEAPAESPEARVFEDMKRTITKGMRGELKSSLPDDAAELVGVDKVYGGPFFPEQAEQARLAQEAEASNQGPPSGSQDFYLKSGEVLSGMILHEEWDYLLVLTEQGERVKIYRSALSTY
ncbi:MAG: hypothetical protein HYY14_05545 [Candidatus Omnitrophica bacterium]|nr:hypothetical protein [Candidatus Omnitrophota bacterium]